MTNLAQRVIDLEDRIAELESALGLDYKSRPEWGLTRSEACVVGMLTKTSIASHARLETALYADRNDTPTGNNVDVFITRARRKLAPFGIEIRNTWGVGYWIPAEQKARLLDA